MPLLVSQWDGDCGDSGRSRRSRQPMMRFLVTVTAAVPVCAHLKLGLPVDWALCFYMEHTTTTTATGRKPKSETAQWHAQWPGECECECKNAACGDYIYDRDARANACSCCSASGQEDSLPHCVSSNSTQSSVHELPYLVMILHRSILLFAQYAQLVSWMTGKLKCYTAVVSWLVREENQMNE